ncbi:MAG: FMN-binding protein [Spirochaetaceae bacterium]|nr:FMN-binding protein [Spirochaetaceae bacterium]
MRKSILIGLKLAVVCMGASLLLGFVNVITLPAIEENRRIALQNALAAVNRVGTPGEMVIVEGSRVVRNFYPVFLDDGTISSYILTVVGDGYAGDLIMLANYELNGNLIAAVMMEHTETPGIGDAPERAVYYEKFIGRGADVPIPTRRSQLTVAQSDSIAGATITFIGVANALAYGSNFVKNKGE